MSSHAVAGGHARGRARAIAVRASAALVGLGLVPVAALVAGVPLMALAALEAVAIGAMFVLERRAGPVVGRWAIGARSEERVGELVAGVDGVRALHDVDTGRGNVDHVLVGRGGVYTIETKTCRGRVAPGAVDGAWLRQAYAQSKYLEALCGRRVTPLLVLCGAFTDPWCRRVRGVWVVSDRMLPRFLRGAPRLVGDAEVAELHGRLVAGLGER